MREKRSRAHDEPEPLFDYDLNAFDLDLPLDIDFDGVNATVRRSLEDEAQADETNHQKQIHMEVTPRAMRTAELRELEEDPLNPDLFIGHHRRMEREERRMQVQEKQELLSTALHLKSQKDQLTGPDWHHHIRRMVRIDNMKDENELKAKRALALEDMGNFLVKFDEYHRRENRREPKSVKDQDGLKPTSPKIKPKPKAKPKAKSPSEEIPKYEPPPRDPKSLIIVARPFAFGHMLPSRVFPPQEFILPNLLVSEVESYELAEELQSKRIKLFGEP